MRKKHIAISLLIVFAVIAFSVFLESAEYVSVKIEYDSNNNPVYIGKAEAGTKDTQAKWQIKRLIWDSSGNCIAIEYAEGDVSFSYIWRQRTNYTYK